MGIELSRLLPSVRPFCGMNPWDQLLLVPTIIMLVAASLCGWGRRARSSVVSPAGALVLRA
jgi:hypothetical protein